MSSNGYVFSSVTNYPKLLTGKYSSSSTTIPNNKTLSEGSPLLYSYRVEKEENEIGNFITQYFGLSTVRHTGRRST